MFNDGLKLAENCLLGFTDKRQIFFLLFLLLVVYSFFFRFESHLKLSKQYLPRNILEKSSYFKICFRAFFFKLRNFISLEFIMSIIKMMNMRLRFGCGVICLYLSIKQYNSNFKDPQFIILPHVEISDI